MSYVFKSFFIIKIFMNNQELLEQSEVVTQFLLEKLKEKSPERYYDFIKNEEAHP